MEVRLHLLVLGICVALVALALVMEPVRAGGERLALGGAVLPELCTFRQVTGLPCPGCGLTRSWVSALHGDLRGSLSHHTLGWLVLLYVVAQAVRHGAWLVLPGRRGLVERAGGRLDRGIVVLAALLLLAWIPTLARAIAAR